MGYTPKLERFLFVNADLFLAFLESTFMVVRLFRESGLGSVEPRRSTSYRAVVNVRKVALVVCYALKYAIGPIRVSR